MRDNSAIFITLFCAIILVFTVMLVFLPEYQPMTVTAKSRIVFKCIDGKLYGDSYLYVGRDQNEDVSKYPRGKNELVIEDGIEISCKNKETK